MASTELGRTTVFLAYGMAQTRRMGITARKGQAPKSAEAAYADFGAALVLKVRHTEERGRDVSGLAESGFRPAETG
jgi:hypothetical protein